MDLALNPLDMDCKKKLHEGRKYFRVNGNCVRIGERVQGGAMCAGDGLAHGWPFVARVGPTQENCANVIFLALGGLTQWV